MGSRNSNELLITLVNFTTPGLVRGQRVAKTLRQRVRTGLDIVRAIVLGANFVMLGRAFLYGLDLLLWVVVAETTSFVSSKRIQGTT